MSAPRTFARLLAGPGDPDRPLLVGADAQGDHSLDLRALRRLARGAYAAVPAGAGVMLARAPASPEAPLAGLLLALLAAGVRVYLPATVGPETGGHLAAFEPWAIITDQRALPGFEGAGRQFRAQVDRLAAACGVPHLDLLSHRWQSDGIIHSKSDGYGISDDWCNASTHGTGRSDGMRAQADWPAALAERPPRRDILCLTTSGSTGQRAALRYHERAWMACAAAFAEAGLLAPDLLGGPTVCPGLCHSMGVRAVMLAVMARAPILFVQPESLTAAPGEVARLLLRHPPRHITAGPALLGALAALADVEPALRRVVRGLRVAVASGAPFDARLAARLPGVRLANAFGTSETQQVSTTLLDAGAPLDTLGRCLPGVRREVRDGALWVRSPFAAAGLLGAPDHDPWWPTGDRVAVDAHGRWRHRGRLDDQLSTGIGVELDRGPVEARYADLPGVALLVVEAHPDCPGLLGLAFLGDRPLDRPALEAALRARAQVEPPRAPFDADRLWAVAPVPGEPPRTGPGKLDRRAIRARWGPLIARLADPAVAEGITLVDPLDPTEADPAWPRRAPRLRALGLDVTVLGGRGDQLEVERAGERFTVLDLVGGFGVNLLGHGDPALLAEARAALEAVPIACQGTARPAEAALCRALAALLARRTARRWAVALANTGAEAVDLALRHAVLRRRARLDDHHRELARRFGRHGPAVRAVIAHNRACAAETPPILVTLQGGFHGTTLAARLVAGCPERRALIAPLAAVRTVEVPRHVPPAALAELTDARIPLRTLVDGPDGPVEADWRPSNLLAVFAEPIQGEGGVHPIAPDALRRLAALDAPLVIDEIQTGLGRTGAFPSVAAPAEVYLLGKALGGGLAKVAAVAIARERLHPEFERVRGSTFAGDAVGCRVARAVVERVEQDDIPARAATVGAAIGDRLRALAARWPAVIADVRGRGLMWGIELRPPVAPDPITGALAAEGWGAVAASWLLHRHRLRVLPTTAAPCVLRIAPSVGFETADLDTLVAGLDGLCAVLDSGDLAALIGPWVGVSIEPVAPPRPPPRADAPIARVAFLHPLQSAERALTRVAPALGRLPRAPRRRLLDRLQGLLLGAPLPTWRHRLFEGRVELDGITICAPPAAFTLARRRGETEPLRRAVDGALALARQRGATVAVLGGATSAVTAAGRAVLPPDGLRVVTGNTFTVAAILHGLEARVAALGAARSTVAIVGATGNIGRALAAALAGLPWIDRLLLVGRAGSGPRLAALAGTLPGRVDLSDDPATLRRASVIVAAIDDPRPLDAAHLPDGPALLLDASAPSVVPPGLSRLRPRLTVASIGRARLPHDPTVRIAGLGRPGTIYACAAEGLLLALDPGCCPHPLVGAIDADAVCALAEAGRRLGLLGG